MCHAHNETKFFSPARTVFFLEGTNLSSAMNSSAGIFAAPPPVFGVPGPPLLAFRHNRRAHLLMGDTHVGKVNKKQYAAAQSDKYFWYPNDQTGRGGGSP
jgi:prepilin-type processing-associated H-X9-DG protein